MYYYSAVLLALSCELLRRRRHPNEELREIPHGDGRLRVFLLAVSSLIGLAFARSALICYAAHDPRAPAWYAHVPIAVVTNDSAFWTHPDRAAISLSLGLVSGAGSFALYFLYQSLRKRGITLIEGSVLIAAYAIIVATAALTPAFSVVDPYDYVGYGALGFKAYSSHSLVFPCSHETWCLPHAPPSLYGPLFLTYAHALVGHIASTSPRLETLRIANVCWVALLPPLLYFLKGEPALVAVAALNPMIIAQYVGDAHNDIIGVDLVLLGLLLAPRFPFATLLLCTAASLVKLPFALIGMLAFSPLALRSRLPWSVASVATSAIASLLWGGRPYAETLLAQNKSVHFFAQADHWLVALIVCGLIGAALTHDRVSLAGAYAIPALAGFFAFSWYALWALPYLARDRSKTATFLIALPATSFFMEPAFQVPVLWNIVIVAMTVYALAQISQRTKRPTLGH